MPEILRKRIEKDEHDLYVQNEYSLFSDYFVKAFWEFKKANRQLCKKSIHEHENFERCFGAERLESAKSYFGRCEHEQFNHCLYLLMNASHHLKNAFEFRYGKYDTLCYASIHKLFEEMQKKDNTNMLFYKTIFYQKDIFNPYNKKNKP